VACVCWDGVCRRPGVDLGTQGYKAGAQLQRHGCTTARVRRSIVATVTSGCTHQSTATTALTTASIEPVAMSRFPLVHSCEQVRSGARCRDAVAGEGHRGDSTGARKEEGRHFFFFDCESTDHALVCHAGVTRLLVANAPCTVY
jgi:hypothetical protein